MIQRIQRDEVFRSNQVSAKSLSGIEREIALVGVRTCSILIVLSCTATAQETAPVESLTVDEQTVKPADPTESVPTPLETEDVPELAARILADMRDAEARLVDGKLDEGTGELQDRINADLARLLAALEQQASQPSPTPGDAPQQQQSGPDPSATGGTGDPGGQPGGGAESESTEGDRPGELSEAELERRRNLATSVWGHLPQRERDAMLGAFSERFLPAYDDLVRQYYEALATQEER